MQVLLKGCAQFQRLSGKESERYQNAGTFERWNDTLLNFIFNEMRSTWNPKTLGQSKHAVGTMPPSLSLAQKLEKNIQASEHYRHPAFTSTIIK